MAKVEAKCPRRWDFFRTVRARLDFGEREYGGAALQRDLSELVGEAREEAADVPGWCAQAWQVLHAGDVPAPRRALIASLLVMAGVIASILDEVLGRAEVAARQHEATRS